MGNIDTMKGNAQLDQAKRDLTEIGCLHGWEAATRDRASWRMILDRAMSRPGDALYREQANKRERDEG